MNDKLIEETYYQALNLLTAYTKESKIKLLTNLFYDIKSYSPSMNTTKLSNNLIDINDKEFLSKSLNLMNLSIIIKKLEKGKKTTLNAQLNNLIQNYINKKVF